MIYLTIFTATFNRAYILPNLFHSLMKQTCMDFEWLIVDDGSVDQTEQMVQSWDKEKPPFLIRYYKKENGGKPRAINFGIQRSQGKFFFMVDSDDWLLPEAVEKMCRWCKCIEDDPKYIGIGAARGYPDGTYLKGSAPKVGQYGYVDATNLQRAEYNLDADMCEAYKTQLFKRYPMAEWPGEKFAPEQIALNEIALDGYLLRWYPDIIYYCDYLEDGLTKGSRMLEKNNPMGYAMMYNHMLKYPQLSPKRKLYDACQMVALSIVGKHPEYILKCENKKMAILALVPGILLSIRRILQYRKI